MLHIHTVFFSMRLAPALRVRAQLRKIATPKVTAFGLAAAQAALTADIA
jgi:hypothetical protein